MVYITSTIISEEAVVATLGVSNFDTNKVHLFPNPVLNELNIGFDTETQTRFKIFDIYGKLILKSENVAGKIWTINTSTLTSGVYFILVITNRTTKSYKFLKR